MNRGRRRILECAGSIGTALVPISLAGINWLFLMITQQKLLGKISRQDSRHFTTWKINPIHKRPQRMVSALMPQQISAAPANWYVASPWRSRIVRFLLEVLERVTSRLPTRRWLDDPRVADIAVLCLSSPEA